MSQSQIMLEDASHGEEVIIVRGTTPIAKIEPVPAEEPKQLRAGFGSGKYALVYRADDFDAPMEDFKDSMSRVSYVARLILDTHTFFRPGCFQSRWRLLTAFLCRISMPHFYAVLLCRFIIATRLTGC